MLHSEHFPIIDTMMTGNPRHDALLKLVGERGYISVEELSTTLDVSTQTIRRDIKKLSDDKLLVRHHGGAGRSSSVINMDYNLRSAAETEEKEKIAAAIADYLPDNCTVFLTIGTTTETIAKHLLKRTGLRVITNSLKVAHILFSKKDFDVMVPGGTLQASNGGITGPSTQEFVKQFRVDYLITSIGSIDEDGTLLDYNFSEVAITQAVMKNARNTLVAADSTKFSTTAAIELGTVGAIAALFTDRQPPKHFQNLLSLHETVLHICQ